MAAEHSLAVGGEDENAGEPILNGVDHGDAGAEVNGDVARPVNGDARQQQGQAGGAGAERQPNKVRITTPYLTKYERARVLGTRALQIRCVRASFFSLSAPATPTSHFASIECVGLHERWLTSANCFFVV